MKKHKGKMIKQQREMNGELVELKKKWERKIKP